MRGALLVFCAAELGALLWWLYIGRERWFGLDEWVFVTERGYSLHALFAPYNGHSTTLPILAYRLLWELFGIRTYAPYETVTVVLHLLTAALLRVIMRRVGLSPWIATVAASLFVVLGAGAHNVLFGFQMTFVGSLGFGLVHLLPADHDGPIDWRDGAGLPH